MTENRWFIVAGIAYFTSDVLGKIIGPRKAFVIKPGLDGAWLVQ